jgi:hypothetical protein
MMVILMAKLGMQESMEEKLPFEKGYFAKN